MAFKIRLYFSDKIQSDLVSHLTQEQSHYVKDVMRLKKGDYWCLCLSRWIQAYNANCAPKVKLDATHASVLEFVELSKLKEFEVN